jgi:beta-mannosidase
VGTKSWTYRTKFQKPEVAPGSKVVLAFEGLDTFADVRLNGETILHSDNMFLPQRVDITNLVKEEKRYVLDIYFDSALLRAREIEKQHPEHKFVCFNGEIARLAVRKAQYHWGWDWGPVLMCAGIWKPVRLEVYSATILDIRTDVNFAADYKSANVRVSVETESVGKHKLHVRITVSLDGKLVGETTGIVRRDGRASADLNIENPSLWMPSGYGSQPLYQVDVTLSSTDEVLDEDSRRIGLRKVELVQEPDSHGKSFYFRINDVDVFCGGSVCGPSSRGAPSADQSLVLDPHRQLRDKHYS